MSESILVGYATRYGSTQEVAEAIAAVLRESGLEVDLQPLRKVQAVTGYRAVVMGAPLYIGSLLKDAQRFLAQHREALAGRPVAVFALGPTRAEEGLAGAREQLDKELEKTPWLTPIAIGFFGGKYAPAFLRFPDNLIAALPASQLHGLPASDAPAWTAIRAWASELAAKLQSA